MGSVLPSILLEVQPGHGLLARFRVVYMPLNRPIQTWFPYDFGPEALNLATYSTLAGSFFNRNTVILADSSSL